MKHSGLIQEAKRKIAAVKGRALTVEDRAQDAIDLAALLLEEAQRRLSPEEKRQLAQLSRMMQDPKGKAFTISLTDQCFRSARSSRIADQLSYILQKMGVPRYLSREKRAALRVFQALGKWVPGLFVPIIRTILRRETSTVILPGEPKALAKHMEKRRREGVRINLNRLGEAILGEDEALRRLQRYLDDLAKPEVEYISIKITTIFSQINLLAKRETLAILAERLRLLLRAAERHTFKLSNEAVRPKFVNLDMEEHRDLLLTVELFKKVLEEPEFKHQSAGIVLQSYLPESFPIQQELTAWAMRRLADGGAPIKIRIVKGANLAMEQVESSLKGWPQAPYPQKSDVDANFKRMVAYGMQKEHAQAVLLGIASHNLFDIAYAVLLCAENDVGDCVCFEMLEGMADHARRVVQEVAGDMLLYCPAATDEEFQHALAYLVRRLDENTAPENFLRHMFGLTPGSKEWNEQAELFALSAAGCDQVGCAPRRTQDRLQEPLQPEMGSGFDNEPDTDWSLPSNQLWASQILSRWKEEPIPVVPLVVAGDSIAETSKKGAAADPSDPSKTLYQYCMADLSEIDRSLQSAKAAESEWAATTPAQRSHLLAEVAQGLRVRRAELIGAMVASTGKTIPEADAEVSEAVDFAEYYRRNIEEVHGLQDISWKPKGTVLVAPPWNFPCSIPAGGILAALAAGNCVLFKPAPEAVLVGWHLAQTLWSAGISKEVLQFIPCPDEPVGSALIADKRIDAIILTGATETAKLFLRKRPGVDLIAETGGKNAIIVSAAADRDLAIKDIVQSAFGHAGQKCSACSLAILEAEVYDDPHFRAQLVDAAGSLKVGSAWDPSTKVNPLIRQPEASLQRGLTQLDEGEAWALEPKPRKENPQLWSPGIRWGVKPGSFTHQTELFGPVLGVMRAENLAHAIDLANGTPYGLTSGLQSLDDREKALWVDSIEAGNCYINRGITGAIVQRQPFGGCKDSSFGLGAKAGGPNYLMQLMVPEQAKLPTEREQLGEVSQRLALLAANSLSAEECRHLQAALGSYTFFWKHYFCKDHDPSLLIGQDNFLRYRPEKGLCIRVQASDKPLDLWKIAAAASVLNASFEVSLDPSIQVPLESIDEVAPFVVWTTEKEEDWAQRAVKGEFKKVRLLSNPSDDILKALAKAGIHFQVSAVLANGRLELLTFLREISISSDYHRYGNLGLREGEKRRALHQPLYENPSNVCGTRCCCH